MFLDFNKLDEVIWFCIVVKNILIFSFLFIFRYFYFLLMIDLGEKNVLGECSDRLIKFYIIFVSRCLV